METSPWWSPRILVTNKSRVSPWPWVQEPLLGPTVLDGAGSALAQGVCRLLPPRGTGTSAHLSPAPRGLSPGFAPATILLGQRGW